MSRTHCCRRVFSGTGQLESRCQKLGHVTLPAFRDKRGDPVLPELLGRTYCSQHAEQACRAAVEQLSLYDDADRGPLMRTILMAMADALRDDYRTRRKTKRPASTQKS